MGWECVVEGAVVQGAGLVAILENAGLLALAAISIFFLAQRVEPAARATLGSAAVGIILGVVSVVVVSLPIQGPLGATFDTRAAPLLVSSFFFGPLSGLVTAGIAALARFHVGGPAVIGGVASCGLYALSGLVLRALLRRPRPSAVSVRTLLLLAVAGTVCVLPSFFVGQSLERGLTILQRFWAVLLIGNVLGVVVLGLMLREMFAFLDARAERERLLKTQHLARRAAIIGVWSADMEQGRLELDDVARSILGAHDGDGPRTLEAFVSVVHPNDRDRFRTTLRDGAARGAPFALRMRVRNADGTFRSVACHGDALDDPGGGTRRAIGVMCKGRMKFPRNGRTKIPHIAGCVMG